MRQITETLVDAFDQELLGKSWFSALLPMAQKAAHFDCGDLTGIDAQEFRDFAQYTTEMFAHDMLALPYPITCFYFHNEGLDQTLLCFKEGGTMRCFSFVRATGTGNAFCASIELLGLLKEPVSDASPMGVSIDADIKVLYCDPPTTHKVQEQLCQWGLSEFMFAVGLLSAQGVETELVEPNPRMNKKRAKRGLPEIMPMHTVYIRVGGDRYRASGRAISSHRSDKSVRLHWRRGHVRKLPSGVLTNVRPALVGKAKLSGELPPKPDYSIDVKSNPNHVASF